MRSSASANVMTNEPSIHVMLSAQEIIDLVDTLRIRVQDERRMFFNTKDQLTQRRCLEAAERLQSLARRLEAEVGASR